MRDRRRTTIAEIRASQDLSRLVIPWFTRRIFVPVAWPLTIAALWMHISANTATLIRALVMLASLVMLAQPGAVWLHLGITSFVLSVAMDSVDGNICRMKDQASFYGKFLDGFVDNLGDYAFPLFVSWHVFSRSGDQVSLIAGVIASMSLAISFTVLNRYVIIELLLQQRLYGASPSVGEQLAPRWTAILERHPLGRLLLLIDKHGMNVGFDLKYVLLICCWPLGRLDLFLIGLALVNSVICALYLITRIARAYAFLNVARTSRSAVRQ